MNWKTLLCPLALLLLFSCTTDRYTVEVAEYDGISLQEAGPGEPELAHQADEYCDIEKLEKIGEICV